MHKGRLEAFSDGVIAIIITIMVLELRAPDGTDWETLRPLVHVFLSYLLSFIYLSIYWNNHHHLWQTVQNVKGGVLWANLHLLFWLSLIPFTTAWMGGNHFATNPVLLYGVVLLGAALAYFILVQVLLTHHEKDSILAKAIKDDSKGKISILLYIVGMAFTFVHPLIACAFYVLVAVIWLVPDQRIEKALK